MATGLALCIVINVAMGFSTSFYLFVGCVALLGLFQGMGVGPSIITVGYWFPIHQRGRASTTWNVSHNLGGGLVATIVGMGISYFGTEHWCIAVYFVPAIFALVCLMLVLYFVKRRPEEEGFPKVEEIYNESTINNVINKPENISAFQIFQ